MTDQRTTNRLVACPPIGGRRGQALAQLVLALLAAAALSGCADTPSAKAYGEELTECRADEVLVCDHVSRIRSASKICACQPERQTLNAEINR